MMSRSIDPLWVARTEILQFRFGPFNFGDFQFRALSLLSNPFLVDPNLDVPLQNAMAMGCEGVVKYGTPVSDGFATFCIEHRAVRYATRYGVRCVVDFDRSFTEYLKKFSGQSRNRLRRMVKKAIAGNANLAALQEYRTPSELRDFRGIAMAISRRSYKTERGWGFPEDGSFAQQLEANARTGAVRGYVLIIDGHPAAYRYCRIEGDVIVDKHTGYDENFAQQSPGTVLLYLVLERLFNEGKFRLFDFDGTEYFAFKEFFATRVIRCARVIWFRRTLRNFCLVFLHWGITAGWRYAARLRDLARRGDGRWPSVRRLPLRWRRVLTRPQAGT